MDPDTFFSRVRKFLIELLAKDIKNRSCKDPNNNMDQIQEGWRIG